MKSFRLHVVIRVVLAVGFGLAAYYFGMLTPFWLMSAWMVLFFVVTIVSLIRFVEKSDRELSGFLMAIRQNDFTNTYPSARRHTNQLHRAFNVITAEFIKLRSEKESNFHFLKTVVEHSGVPLMAYTVDDEEVTLVNQSVKALFGIPYFTKLGSLQRADSALVDTIRSLRTGDKVLVKVKISGELMYLSIVTRELILQGRRNKVIAFHNINAELDQKEVESWQKLIRVMTHEIKNSVIPISTLAEVINDMLKGNGTESSALGDLSPEDQEDLIVSIQTIEKRSKGLVKFVASYGDLARVPRPELQEVDLCELVREVVRLQEKPLHKAGIKLETNFPKGALLLSLDAEMIQQVVINLVKNAAEALTDAGTRNGQIQLIIAKHASEVVVQVVDNGPGIEEDIMDQIFIPFFTTKKEGSGIGLSYSRQIMRAHNGNLRVKSTGSGALFELGFWVI
ncbi:sensor histidine kinase [Marinoscillum sp.]|uniref:sensor histidine kinase n=1 Tax=Marinoscillum sp. TaxID=2024838 RepID=UPI003BACDEF8